MNKGQYLVFGAIVLVLIIIGLVWSTNRSGNVSNLAQVQQTFFQPDTDGCQLYQPYVWTYLEPSGKWLATVDLSQCTSQQLGWFYYYGYIAFSNRADTLKDKYGVVLKAQDLITGKVYTSDSGSGSQQIILQLTQPTRLLLSAENTSSKTNKVRMTWVAVNPTRQ